MMVPLFSIFITTDQDDSVIYACLPGSLHFHDVEFMFFFFYSFPLMFEWTCTYLAM